MRGCIIYVEICKSELLYFLPRVDSPPLILKPKKLLKPPPRIERKVRRIAIYRGITTMSFKDNDNNIMLLYNKYYAKIKMMSWLWPTSPYYRVDMT